MKNHMEGSVASIRQDEIPRVAVIILNWNRWKDTIECLESLYRIGYPSYDVIVVDNNSKDDSVQKIKEYALGKVRVESKYFGDCLKNKPIRVIECTRKEIGRGNIIEHDLFSSPSDRKIILIRNERNYGFAEGNNIALRFALRLLNPSYVLLLNDDTVVERNFLTRLVNVAGSEKEIGIVGPKVYYYDFSGRSDIINFAGEDIVVWKGKGTRYGTNEVDNGQHDRIREVGKVDGVCMLIKRVVLDSVGLLDPAFFAYWEETDLCFRAKRKGYRLLYVPKAMIWHKASTSHGGLFNPTTEYYLTRNRFLFVKKNASVNEKIRFLIYLFSLNFWISILFILRISSIFPIERNSVKLLSSFVRGVRDGLKLLVAGRV